MFDDQLLQAFMDTFYGFGNYRGRYWFVGMEHGGGGSPEEVARRVATWNNQGRPELVDIVTYSRESGISKWFDDPPKLQPTYKGLIRILLSIEHKRATTEDLRTYQRSLLGRSGGGTCLPELLPLPSRSTGHWLYAEHSALPSLRSRKVYKEHYGRALALVIKKKIEAYRPDVVVFYSLNTWYVQWWELIAGGKFTWELIGAVRYGIARNKGTVFAITHHPAQGVSNDYLEQIGNVIASMLAESSES
jgi:hypothetical protein